MATVHHILFLHGTLFKSQCQPICWRSILKGCYAFKFHTSQSQSNKAQTQNKPTLNACYSLLDLDSNCSEDDIRSAYLKKVKEYHPDRNTSVSDASKFALIQDAYKTAMDHKRQQAFIEEEEENLKQKKEFHDENNIKHTVPQHRRYLTYDGVGFGSPSKRQRQFNQVRVMQANEAVFEHRKLKYGQDETSIVNVDKAQARKIKISNLIDRVVDDLIRESMQRGDFDNLSGQGKPLDYSDHNPFIDTTTHNINKIMVNNGYKPEWIMLSKEIRDSMMLAREKLAVMREKLGPPPYSEDDQMRWEFHTHEFSERVQDVNKMINKFNFIVPFMEKQMVHYNVDQNVDKILSCHKNFLPRDEHGRPMEAGRLGPLPQVHSEDVKIRWGDVWSNIKDVFKSR